MMTYAHTQLLLTGGLYRFFTSHFDLMLWDNFLKTLKMKAILLEILEATE